MEVKMMAMMASFYSP